MPPEFKFEPYTTFYKPQNAYWLARASQLAYARKTDEDPTPNQEFIFQELKAWDSGFSEVTTFNNKSTQAFIAKHDGGGQYGSPGFVWIAFRGTDEKADWADNLGLSAVNFPADHRATPIGKVHSGFYQAFLDVWDSPDIPVTMKSVLERSDYRPKPFWITGHSLGGALASICAFNFFYEDISFYGVYTYGQPRSCDRALMRTFNVEAKNRYFRFQNNNDLVSRIPQRLAGYSHVGSFIYIDTEQQLSADIGAWYQFTDRLEGAKEYLEEFKGGLFRDHDIGQYVESIERNINVIPKGL